MKSPRRPGRPLSFDRQAILEQALLLFWRDGYAATSIRDLTAATGAAAPSLYAAFGDKEGLFAAVVARYLGDNPIAGIAEAPTARLAAKSLLEAAALAYTGDATPPGCLLAKASVGSPIEVAGAMATIRASIEAALHARFERPDAGLPRGFTSLSMAALVMAVLQGMAVLAQDGAPRDKLATIAQAALLAWPKEEQTSMPASQAEAAPCR